MSMPRTERDSTAYDYVIVGGGSAGCVLANRLSAAPHNQVLLLEAGPAGRTPLVSVPIGFGLLYHHKTYNWRWKSQPEVGLKGRRIDQPLGRLLGGTSAINGMMYMRGNAADYDGWAQTGLIGWSYEDILPYFRRSEDNPERPGDPYHGQGGPLRVTRARGENELYHDFLAAGQAMGHPLNTDFNGARQEGLGFYDFNTKDGRRVSSATAFLRPALSRPNLSLRTKTTVRRIDIIEGRATGLVLHQNGIETQVAARREIVLAGGAINSPQLLMLSGVGPAALLGTHGIRVVADAPEVESGA